MLAAGRSTLAFLDTHPSAPGHTLVIIRRHGKTIMDYSTEELAQLMETVQKVATALTRAFATDMLTIGVNHGELSGVGHLHVHIIPRTARDNGGIVQSLVRVHSGEKLDTIQHKIKSYI